MKKNVLYVFCKKNIFYLPIFAGIFSVTACTGTPKNGADASLSGQTENQAISSVKKEINIVEMIANLQNEILNLEIDNTTTKSVIASLKTDLQSQKEELQTQKKNIEILKRGLRSGIFEEFPEDTLAINKNDAAPSMFPSLAGGSNGLTESKSPFITLSVKDESGDDAIGPKQSLANAEIKIRKGNFKEGLLEIGEMKKKFPNYDDHGRSFLLGSEAWIKLKEYNNALQEVRNFYLRYPTSADLAYAKLLEGQALEGNGSFEKAALLYNEVIALSPHSTLAQSARTGMLKMRDER